MKLGVFRVYFIILLLRCVEKGLAAGWIMQLSKPVEIMTIQYIETSAAKNVVNITFICQDVYRCHTGKMILSD